MKKIITLILAAAMLLSVAVGVSAAVTKGKMVYLPGTEDEVDNMPKDADLGDLSVGSFAVSEDVPQRDGYEFLYWELDYDVFYKVTYVVNPDPKFGTPEESTVPTDPTEYDPGQMVDVEDQLTTDVGYAYNENDEKVTGTWTWVHWDKDDFQIYEDTTVTGGWMFTEDEPVKYHYTVEYRLWTGTLDSIYNGKKVHDNKTVEIDSLGIPVTEYAYSIDELKKPYCLKRDGKYRYRIVTPYQETVISYDDFKIIILYEEIPKGQ